LSHLAHDAEDRPDHRIQACREYAEARGWEVVHVATDTNVSGASELESRPGMREVLEWLPKVDFVIAAKVDRYARSMMEFERLWRIAAKVDAALITADGIIGPGNIKFIAQVLAAFAEMERETIRARVIASKKHFRQRGNWLGGAAPYGFRTVGKRNAKKLAIDEEAAAVIRWAVDQLLNHGASFTGLARELNERGVLSPADHARKRDGRKVRGAKWSSATLRDVMISPVVRGFMYQSKPVNGKRSALTHEIVRNDDGSPVRVGPELLDAETWQRVRDIADSRAVGRHLPRTGKSLLLHVAECTYCHGPLYRQRRTTKSGNYSTYVCRKGVGKHGEHPPIVITAPMTEDLVTETFLRSFGSFELMRWQEPDGSAAAELVDVKAAIDHALDVMHDVPKGSHAYERARERVAMLTTRAAELERLADEAANASGWVSTGSTIRDEWERRTVEGRNALLKEFGTRAVVHPVPAGAMKRWKPERISVTFEGPAWVREVDPATAELLGIAFSESV
jgi:DNA invertase Pin-like site-specific DNA recombinase